MRFEALSGGLVEIESPLPEDITELIGQRSDMFI